MTECDYNLLDEEWIPVLLTDGGVEKVGILGAFERANDIEDLACELPTQNPTRALGHLLPGGFIGGRGGLEEPVACGVADGPDSRLSGEVA